MAYTVIIAAGTALATRLSQELGNSSILSVLPLADICLLVYNYNVEDIAGACVLTRNHRLIEAGPAAPDLLGINVPGMSGAIQVSRPSNIDSLRYSVIHFPS
jgi:hypothetical protein